METAARIVSGLLGVTCLIGLVLIQEDEERGFRNRLVDWWVNVTATSEGAKQKVTALSQVLVAAVLAKLDLIFGARLLHPHFLFGSVVLSTLAVSIALAVATVVGSGLGLRSGYSVKIDIVFSLALLVGSILSLVTFTRGKSIPAVIVLLLTITAIRPSHSTAMERFVFIWGAGAICDALNLPLSRWALRKARHSRFAGLWISGMLLVPLLLVPVLGVAAVVSTGEGAGRFAAIGVLGFLYINLAIGAGLSATVGMLVANAMVWAVLSRVLNTLHDRGPSRKHVMALGILMIGLAIAPSPTLWVAKWAGLPEPEKASEHETNK